MDYFGQLGILQYLLLWLAAFLCFVFYTSSKKRKYNLPPGPRGLPIVGNLPFLGNKPYEDFSKLGRKYGGIFRVYLGRTLTVVVTDVTVAKQLLNMSSTADRPPGAFDLMPDGFGFGETNGQEWTEQRRYTMMEMKNLGFGKSHWEDLVKEEVSECVDLLVKFGGEPVEINNYLSASISNNVLALVTNQRLPVGHPRRDKLDEGMKAFMTIYDQSRIIVFFPKLFKFLINLGLVDVGNKMKSIMSFNKSVREEIEDTKKTGTNTYVSNYFEEIEKNKRLNLGNAFNERNLIGNAQSLILAGSDTTSISLIWLLLAMASFPDVQKKIHEELDRELDENFSINWVDRDRFPYVMATIMEGQRWRTVAPLNIIHRTNEDMQISGYDIPKGAHLMCVLWAFHNDTKYWKNPHLFQPERFLSDDGRKIIENEAFMPFSYGKRVCIGKTVAYIELFHYFVSIMKKLRVLPASENQLPDLEGFLGISLQPKKQPLRFVKRNN